MGGAPGNPRGVDRTGDGTQAAALRDVRVIPESDRDLEFSQALSRARDCLIDTDHRTASCSQPGAEPPRNVTDNAMDLQPLTGTTAYVTIAG